MSWVESVGDETWKGVPGKGPRWANPKEVERLAGSGSREERTELRQSRKWDIWSEENHPGPFIPGKGIQIWPR